MVATANLDEDFKAAIYFLSKGPSARIQFLNDDMKALLSAYQVLRNFFVLFFASVGTGLMLNYGL